jgi:hypothetical protein
VFAQGWVSHTAAVVVTDALLLLPPLLLLLPSADTGVMTLQAPHNRWAQLQHARRGEDAADLLEALGERPGSFRHPQDDIPPDLVWPSDDEEDEAEE